METTKRFTGPAKRRHPGVDAAVLHFLRDGCKVEPVTKQDVQVKATQTAKPLGKTNFKARLKVGATYLFAVKDCHSAIEQPSLKRLQRYFMQLNQKEIYAFKHIGTAEETAVYFHIPRNCNFDAKGANKFKVRSSG
jgi:hypothetical protein